MTVLCSHLVSVIMSTDYFRNKHFLNVEIAYTLLIRLDASGFHGRNERLSFIDCVI